MRFTVYILYSPSVKAFYKGQTSDIDQRLHRHNAGYEKYTQKGVPWHLLWFTEKSTRSEAVKLEMKLKNLSKKRLIQFMLKYKEGIVNGQMENITGFEP